MAENEELISETTPEETEEVSVSEAPEEASVAPVENTEELTDEEIRSKKSHDLHKESQRQYDIGQNAMCFVVLGALGVIIGIIFIFIALKRENNVIVGFDTGSLAFYIFIILLAVGGAALIYGLIRYFISYFTRKKVIDEINHLK